MSESRPNTSPEDQEVLRRVYAAQMAEYTKEHAEAAKAASAAEKDLDDASDEYWSALRREATLAGKIEALKALAAKDGITDL